MSSDQPTRWPRFHLAIAVDDLAIGRAFYGEVLGLVEGRSDRHWVDFNLYGHQLVIHEVEAQSRPRRGPRATNPVDGDAVPVPHFGVLLEVDQWHRLADRLRSHGVAFVVEPHLRFEGEAGEQHTMFFVDPAGNAIEFKAFTNDDAVFAT